jgi:hypothetical protein
MSVRKRLLATALAIAASACSPDRVKPSQPSAVRSDGSAVPSIGPAPSASASAGDASEGAWAPGSAGEVYLAVAKQGILRIEGDKAVIVYSTSEEVVDMALSPSGALFASFYEIGTIKIRGANAEAISKTPYQKFGIRSDTDVWATPDEFSWAVHHYDGKSWTAVKKREDFKGKFDDNKLDGLVVTPDAVWVSSWNGLFRGSGKAWDKIEPPESEKPPWQLFVKESKIVGWFSAGFFEFERDGARWSKLAWPGDHALAAVSPSGVAVGVAAEDKRRIRIGKLGVKAAMVTSAPTKSAWIADASIDDGGRAWIAGDYSFIVMSPAGKVLAEFEPGMLAGIEGKIERVAVRSGGLARLPAKASPLPWEIRGVVQIYKSSAPLADARVFICAAHSNCAGGGWKVSTMTAKDGSFVLRDVPPGDFSITVEVPSGIRDCETPFTASPGRSISIARDCAKSPGQSCDIKTIRVCLPFEMPPHRP